MSAAFSVDEVLTPHTLSGEPSLQGTRMDCEFIRDDIGAALAGGQQLGESAPRRARTTTRCSAGSWTQGISWRCGWSPDRRCRCANRPDARAARTRTNAAKFAVRGFTEALRQEMLVAGHPVKVTCVHPGGIKTAVALNASVADGDDAQTFAEFFDRWLAIHSPEMAAETIIEGVRKGRVRVVVGWEAKALDALARITGPLYQRLTAAAVARFFPWATSKRGRKHGSTLRV